MSQEKGLLVKVRGDGKAFRAAAKKGFGISGGDVETILTLTGKSEGKGIKGASGSTWLRLNLPEDGNPWDRAHAVMGSGKAFSGSGAVVEAVEPDILQHWPYSENGGEPQPDAGLAAQAAPSCTFDDQDPNGGKPLGQGAAWNLGQAYSQLAAARQLGGNGKGIRIAHLDTGYDPNHATLPLNLNKALQRNFVKGEPPNDARDRIPQGKWLSNPGHGTGTLSLLAGNKLVGASPGWKGFKDFIGGAPEAEIIPVRVADWVVRFTTGTLVQGFEYARQQDAHVLSMSMGGVSSQALVDAVNLAYEHGLVMVTAAGNNFAGRPTPKSIVFPARLKRVLAACGVMADGRAYTGLKSGTMQGNHGPASKMDTALGAYTPNVPWAQIGCPSIVDMDGAGTSAATPQIAAAAALWLAHHWKVVAKYPEPWMRVEAVRHALFSVALKSTASMGAARTKETLGQGVMQALAALAVSPPGAATLQKLPPAKASWSWLNVLFNKGGVSLAGQPDEMQSMLALELTQMAHRIRSVDEAIEDPERPAEDIPATARNRYLEAALAEGNPSKKLQAELEGLIGQKRATVSVAAPQAAAPIRRKVYRPPLPERRLRVFALDPSVAKNLASLAVNETTLSLPWDDTPATELGLQPGPVGEYLEVVDVDPASNRVYDPVDLNDKLVLAQSGLPPSEGNPQFHQQMVYAVGMATIRNFERALGRRALWAPRYKLKRKKSGEMELTAHEVPRLRIYPHALRADNAYYSPKKIALLFGYFPADSREGDATAAGSMVFSCLSSDIIAHEMSHALLDGLHRRFQESSNPDVPAFHEAFADIVALFQHFTVTELVRFEIARSRGNLGVATLLGGLARQFGEGVSRRGPLRNYLDPKMKEMRYADTEKSHDRGSILVFAVYEAFQSIVSRRTSDLIRIATGGSGVLPEGALHPDLVERLTTETCKAASHVLRMCIRALDYSPSVDITFGEYLRALITSDVDLVADDSLGYRVAFMEAFRNRGILPRSVRTISVESLAWSTPDDPSPHWLADLVDEIDLRWDQDIPRKKIFALNEKNRYEMYKQLDRVLTRNPEVYRLLGLVPDLPRFDREGKVNRPPKTGGTTFEVHSVRPARRVGPDGSFRTDVVVVINQRQPVPIDGKDLANGWFWFRGGATLILDVRKGREAIRYSVIKNSDSASRLERQKQYASGAGYASLQSMYFGDGAGEPFAAMHSTTEGV
ncbi:S8 family serine peptidase [Pseudoxanthomonas mexicana]